MNSKNLEYKRRSGKHDHGVCEATAMIQITECLFLFYFVSFYFSNGGRPRFQHRPF